jgi:steroid delta-isomerase-like uncharacterized protein
VQDTTPTGARATVERYLEEVLNLKDLAVASELILNEHFRQKVSAFVTSFPDLETTVHHIVVEGDLVAAHISGRATHRDTFQGMPATGKKWDATCSAFYRVIDGRIVDAWVNWDLLTIMEQIGAIRRTEAASA